MFNFVGYNLDKMQVLSHVCMPLPYFLGQGMHFCKEDWIAFVDVEDKPTNFFSSLVAY